MKKTSLTSLALCGLALIAGSCSGQDLSAPEVGESRQGIEFSFLSPNPPIEWEGELFGLFETERSPSNSSEGRCFYILGVVSLVDAGDAIVAGGRNTPDLGAYVGDEFIPDSIADCEDDALVDAGYEWRYNVNITEGSSQHFFTEIFVPSGSGGDLSSVVMGEPREDDSVSFTLEILDKLPAVGAQAIGPDGFADGAESLEGASFTFVTDNSSVTWDVELFGVVEVPRSANENCFLVLGELTPTSIKFGSETTDSSRPRLGMIIDGEYLGGGPGGCETDSVEALGYGSFYDLKLAEGAVGAFYASISTPIIDQVEARSFVFGDPSTADPIVVFEATSLLATAPPLDQ